MNEIEVRAFAKLNLSLNVLGRLDNDRVRNALKEEAPQASRLILKEGEPPGSSPEENLRALLEFSRRHDNITVREAE